MFSNRFIYIFLASIVFVTAVQTAGAKAQELEIKNCVLDKKQGRIRINFGVQLKQVKKLDQYLSEGSPLELICRGSLYQDRTFWMDKKLNQSQITFRLDNNPLTQKYVLTDLGNQNSFEGSELKKLLHNHWKELELDLGEWDSIPKGDDYTFQLQVMLKRGEVPGWMEFMLFFWSWDQLSSKVYEIEFSH